MSLGALYCAKFRGHIKILGISKWVVVKSMVSFGYPVSLPAINKPPPNNK